MNAMEKSKHKKNSVAPPGAVVSSYAREAAHHPWLLALIALGTVAIQAAGLITPLFLRQFFNTLSSVTPTPAAVHALFVTTAWIALVSFFGWVARRVQAQGIMHLETRVMSRLYSNAFDYLIGHSYQFFVNQFAGTLTRRVTKYASAFETLFDSLASTFAPSVLFVVGAVAILFTRNATLGIVLGLWAIFFVMFQVYVSRLRQPIRMQRAEEDSALTGAIADAISNQNTIMLFAGAAHEHKIMGAAVNRWRAITLRSWTVDDYIWGGQGLLMVAINIGLLLGALHYWQEGLLTVGDFVLIQSYLIGIFDNLNGMTRELRRVYDAFADAGEIVYLLLLQHGVSDRPDAHALRVSTGKIEFKDVGFRFHEGNPMLRDFNLTIGGGEKVALVGPSGAGKSTITRLLLRFYDVDEGGIEIDGQDLRDIPQASLRSAIAFVPQEPILFHRTLMENIRYGKRDASDEEVMEAARKAHCSEFISALPERYDTYVGERGVRLSGGERQRVAIARAILKDAPILILDEATSSLDSESEALIQDALGKLMTGKTVIAIAHRLSTVMHMDRILVIQHGQIVSEGSHADLVKGGGLYQKLWNIQAGGFADGGAPEEALVVAEGEEGDEKNPPLQIHTK